jgi:hypothetical protein
MFRLNGIAKNLSFWNDEINVAILAKGILNTGRPVTPTGSGWGLYQVGLNYLTALSFKLNGVSEWSGRFPSVIAGTFLIATGFFVAKELLNKKTGLIFALILSFSQIQLAWSTQLRPYIWLEIFTLLITYFLYKYIKDKQKIIDKNVVFSILISGISILFHGTGLINLLIVSVVFLYKIINLKKFKYLLLIPIFGIIGFLMIFNSFTGGLDLVKSVLFKIYFEPLHYRIFLTHNYLWLIIGATIGFFTLLKRNRELAVLIGWSIALIFFIAIFKINPNYVRYSLPAFPLMFLLLAEGAVSVTNIITKKEYLRCLFIILAFGLLSLTGKFVFWPKYFYSINADVRENPIVDYKQVYSRIESLGLDKNNSIVIDAWDERPVWFLPKQNFAVFTRYPGPVIDPYYGEPVLRSISEFNQVRASYKTGVVVVEDWESLTPPEINEYVRKNLKFEFTIQDLQYNENDHWGVSVYSWGI